MTSSLQLNEATQWSVTGFVLLSQLSTMTDAHDGVCHQHNNITLCQPVVVFMHHLLSLKFKPFICRFVAGYFILYWSHWEKLSTAFDPALRPVPWQECHLGLDRTTEENPTQTCFHTLSRMNVFRYGMYPWLETGPSSSSLKCSSSATGSCGILITVHKLWDSTWNDGGKSSVYY